MNDQQARDAIDGTLLITTGTPFMRFRLNADGENARLEPVEDGGDTVTLDWSELSTLYNRGDVYHPQHPGGFGTAVDQLAGRAVIMTDGGEYEPTGYPEIDERVDAVGEISSGHELYRDEVSLTVTFDRLNEPQAIALIAMFNTWEGYGRRGASRWVEFFVDGDGPFHPAIDYDIEGDIFTPDDEVFSDLADAAESAGNNAYDFDAVTGWFISRALDAKGYDNGGDA